MNMNNKKCDIVLPIWSTTQDTYELTKKCIENIIKNTHYPYRIIAIDNGSEEPAKSYLESCSKDRTTDFILIRNEKNIGTIKAENQGMRLSEAKYICILNNDILVADGWLSIMVEVMEKNPSIGLLNPLSNTFGQGPKDIQGLNDFAHSIAVKKNRFVEAGECISFCELIKREVIDKIGYLDEDLKLIFFDDTDYSIRARKAGFICAIAMGAYVYHYEHKTVGGGKSKSRFDEIFNENQKLFYKKWGKPLRIVYISSVDFRNNRELVKRKIKEAISISKKGNYVYIFQYGDFNGNVDDFYESLGVIRFLNAQIFFKGRFFKLYCIWRIFTRKKKRFNAIFIDDPKLYYFLKKTFFLHKSKIYYEPEEADLEELWKERYLLEKE